MDKNGINIADYLNSDAKSCINVNEIDDEMNEWKETTANDIDNYVHYIHLFLAANYIQRHL